MEGIRDGGEEGGKGVDCCGVSAFSTLCTGADSDAHCSDSVHNSPCTIFSLSSEGAGDGGLVGSSTSAIPVSNTGVDTSGTTGGCAG